MCTIINLRNYLTNHDGDSGNSLSKTIEELVLTNPATFFSLVEFCREPQTSFFSKDSLDLLIEKKLIFRDLSVPFEVRALIG